MARCQGCGRPTTDPAVFCHECGALDEPTSVLTDLPGAGVQSTGDEPTETVDQAVLSAAGQALPATALRAAIGIGVGFQPVPGCRLVPGTGSKIARIAAVAGTPVHAIVAGTLIADAPLVLRGMDGLAYRYAGVRPGRLRPGATVGAGEILGAVADQMLEVTVLAADGSPVDAVELLLGLPDPNDLGYAGAGVGVDPFGLDRELAPRRGRP